ncbi:tripartite tricarboxylate transporter substrate binding protein [Reyranella sp. CPCC 100927]|uniref:Bug family tripartite tricarboxylate transporter substrate binding protein n=1 Tax=Reyranella sp. CPCC 100927 TaxID=2599616 RepID=UPI0011B46EDD|nr:tripartite tricarboxylate transporter substrate binding protein [Reyranella sp. CPCC 100927]TWT10193.1 tripartite tricarboxylate transporter substrate binding protein [Reyranella sp. CPCC 100927]
MTLAPLRRRRLVQFAGASVAAFAAHDATAQDTYPDKPIRIVVPFPPGALTDAIGRVVADRLRDSFKQPVVVENKPGASTLLGASQVAKAAPDGYTLMVATSTTLGIAPALFTNPPIKVSDLTGVAMIGAVTLFLVTHPAVPATDIPTLMAALRAKPDGYTYASPGNGTIHHLVMEMLCRQENARAQHVPYQGSGPAITDVMSGRVDFMWIDATVVTQHIRARRVRPLAVTGSRRTPAFPDVPALTESHPDIDLVAWQSIAAPAGTPAAVIGRLNGEINALLNEPAFRGRLADMGVEANPMSIAAFNALIQRDAGRWAEAVKQSGAKVD